ncbi:MAG: Abi family protein [Muribaculaceae bacterium]|nr:Abi family protein [Muribaculaceae bacterium]
MGRRAKPLQQQIDLLRRRGMIITDEAKVRDIILEIGWYRLSLYWFPFERRYPDMMADEHRFVENTRFEDALMLYAFDFNLRNMLMRMLERVETAFRTFVIYHVSTRHPESPHWFADTNVVTRQHAANFEKAVYQPLRKLNQDIILHHRRFPRDRFAPAWKTLEFVTFGAMCQLYASLTSHNLRMEISRHFGIESPEVMDNYLEVLRALRNSCAHGNVMYAFHSPVEIRRQPAAIAHGETHNLRGSLQVLHYLLRQISPRVAKELKNEVDALLSRFDISHHVHKVLTGIAGFKNAHYNK